MILRKILIVYKVYKQWLMFIGLVLSVIMASPIYLNEDFNSSYIYLIIFIRIIVFLPILYFLKGNRKNEFMYYRNMGLTKWELLSYIYALDTIITIIIICLTHAITQ